MKTRGEGGGGRGLIEDITVSGPNFFKFQSMFILAFRCNRHQKTVSIPTCNLDHYVCKGNRTDWSPIRSVIIRVINKIGRPRSGSPICLITSMITDRIGRHEVLLPINHNFNKICDIWGSLFNQKTRNSEISFLLAVKQKKPFKRAGDGAYCPIT